MGRQDLKKMLFSFLFCLFLNSWELLFNARATLLWAFIITKSLNFIWMDADASPPSFVTLSTKPFHVLKRRRQTAFRSGLPGRWPPPLACEEAVPFPQDTWFLAGLGWLESDSGRHRGLLVAFWTNYWSHNMYILRQCIKLNVMFCTDPTFVMLAWYLF